jgi:mRNA interferase HigB
VLARTYLTHSSQFENLVRNVHVFSRRAIRDFIQKHPLAEPSLDTWYRAAKQAEWSSVMDVRKTFPHADAVGSCTVFNIHGNRYRLIAKIDYGHQALYIRGIYTHQEYDQGRWKDGC